MPLLIIEKPGSITAMVYNHKTKETETKKIHATPGDVWLVSDEQLDDAVRRGIGYEWQKD